ncbi:MAG: right-handed parallel beta-helix repeat-containing protein, partial [Planctomycetes bacterium]|nr:right-handed parallel beta-helix repeat-containing protein [Planctomycetota bacterium]
DEADDDIVVLLARTEIRNNAEEGLGLSGIIDAHIRDCHIHDNGQEGIEAEPLRFSDEEKGRLTLERTRLISNGSMGIDLSATPHRGRGRGKFRVSLKQVVCANNADHGASLDIHDNEAGMHDIRIEIRDSRFTENGKAGLNLDAETPSAMRIVDSECSRNRLAGLRVDGESERTLCRVHRVLATGNEGPSLSIRGLGAVYVWRSQLDRVEAADGGWHALAECVVGDASASADVVDETRTPVPASRPSTALLPDQDLELIDPRPGSDVGSTGWLLRFRDGTSGTVVRLFDRAGGEIRLNLRSDEKRVEARPARKLDPGSVLSLEVRPCPDATAEGCVYRFDYRVGAP